MLKNIVRRYYNMPWYIHLGILVVGLAFPAWKSRKSN